MSCRHDRRLDRTSKIFADWSYRQVVSRQRTLLLRLIRSFCSICSTWFLAWDIATLTYTFSINLDFISVRNIFNANHTANNFHDSIIDCWFTLIKPATFAFSITCQPSRLELINCARFTTHCFLPLKRINLATFCSYHPNQYRRYICMNKRIDYQTSFRKN